MRVNALTVVIILCHVIEVIWGHAGSVKLYKHPRGDVIRTRGGKTCVQQYKYKDETYTNECTREDDTAYWCATSDDYPDDSTAWDYCTGMTGRKSETETETDKLCYFPFYWGGEIRFSCVQSKKDKDKTWCPTSSGFFPGNINWDYCKPPYWQAEDMSAGNAAYRIPAPAKKYKPIHPSTCKPEDPVCVITLVVEEKLTMVYNQQLLVARNGKLYDPKGVPVDPNKVIVGDSYFVPRRAVVINGTLPGPRLDVYEGQKLIINVHNNMFSDATTIHWHGLHSKSTAYFDGTGFINMCPIAPSLVVTSPVYASPHGTHWYHAHVGFQMGDGMFGPLIVHKKNPPVHYDGDFVLLLAVWNRRYGANEWFLYKSQGELNEILGDKYNTTDQFKNFEGGLINGKGRLPAKNGSFITDGPLETYVVEPNKRYRFRIIGGQADKEFILHIHGHWFEVIASDGADIVPFKATSLGVSAGERYDIVVTTDQPIANYWIRAMNKNGWSVDAILRYRTAPDSDPVAKTSKPIACSATTRCVYVNCLYEKPIPAFTVCKDFDKILSYPPVAAPALTPDSPDDIFLNFGKPGYGNKEGPHSINGIKFVFPKTSLLTNPNSGLTDCDPMKCGSQQLCSCTHHLHIRKDSTIQMVFMSMGKGKGKHPIHLHGHHFSVLKYGLPVLDSKGKNIRQNPDIACDGDFCNKGKWANSSWGGDNIPGLNLNNPPQKDTIFIPKGGYAVIRFKADNPGVWFLHCHIEEHLADGMAMVVLEGQEEWDVPSSFPTCGRYTPFFTRKAARMKHHG
ncbi:uncharacterized protein LOC141910414 [Tubulanus polymorphus]|uniref:uncharacterized protein LOC141910414 n=1 Tax=Tubulanus polymorphus TaxID=672921 RepID=UPI003DA449D4